MKKMITLWMFLILALPLTAKGADSETPFNQMIVGSCLIEPIALSGTLFTSVTSTPFQTGVRIEIRERLRGSGIGLDSGTRFTLKAKDSTRIIISSEALELYVFKNSFTVKGAGNADDLQINYLFKQTPVGVIVDDFLAQCK